MEKEDEKSARRRLLKGHLEAGIVAIPRPQLGDVDIRFATSEDPGVQSTK